MSKRQSELVTDLDDHFYIKQIKATKLKSKNKTSQITKQQQSA